MTTTLQPTLIPATAPIESTGRDRHDVSLLVVRGDATIDTRFRRIGEHLRSGDVLVVNTSATEPAALVGSHNGIPIGVHISGPAQHDGWVVELRRPDRSGPILTAVAPDRIELDHGSMTLVEPVETTGTGVRLWKARWSGTTELTSVVRRHGRPVRYSYVPRQWPISAYRTVFEIPRPEFSSAEMPSAARPFTRDVIGSLRRRGIEIAPITLHTGVSSLESHEGPMPERFEVEEEAAAIIERARARGRRVIAVGTTSARAVESAVNAGSVAPARGWTDLVLSPDRPTVAVDGLITGWHPPEASHLDLIEAVVGRDAISIAYRDALTLGYRSHEFGDSCLLLRE